MLIFGHPKIPSPPIITIAEPTQIARTPANAIVHFPFDFSILAECAKSDVRCAVEVTGKKEAVYAAAMGAAYLVCRDLGLAKAIQRVAEEYLFDSKVIVRIDERLLELAIDAGIDGAWLK